MIDARHRRILRIVDSGVTALQTWQGLMRTSGGDVPVQLTLSLAWSAVMLGKSMGPMPTHVWEGPERLDIRTRIGFLLNGISMIGCAGAAPRMLSERRLDRHDRMMHRLARESLWRRLTATAPHGPLFAVAATGLAVLSGVTRYRQRTDGEVYGSLLATLPFILGEIFPTLPLYGMARAPRIPQRWLRPLTVVGTLVTALVAAGPLRAAFLSQEHYEERRRRWEQRMEGAT